MTTRYSETSYRSMLDFLVGIKVVALRATIPIFTPIVLKVAWRQFAATGVGIVQRNVVTDLLLAQLSISRPATVAPIRNHLLDGQTQIIALVRDTLGYNRALVPGTGGGVTIRDHTAISIGAEMRFITELFVGAGPRYQGRIRVGGAYVGLIDKLATPLSLLEIVISVFLVL